MRRRHYGGCRRGPDARSRDRRPMQQVNSAMMIIMGEIWRTSRSHGHAYEYIIGIRLYSICIYSIIYKSWD